MVEFDGENENLVARDKCMKEATFILCSFRAFIMDLEIRICFEEYMVYV